jgi:hypothetical protein
MREMGEDRVRTEAVAATLVGLDEAGATAAAEAAGCAVRVGWRDGTPFVLTMDYQPSRINLTIDAGRVTGTDVG